MSLHDLTGKVRGHELCLWVTVTIKGGRQATADNYVETIGGEVFIGYSLDLMMNSDVV